MRIAISLRRCHRDHGSDDDLAALVDQAPGADLSMLAARFGADLRAAMQSAIATLPARSRAILRLYYADGHGVEEIGRAYRVHASSVSRWLAKARSDILAETRARLMERLSASESQIDSFLAHAASVEISLDSILRTRP
jgi:RNA polymerase sigma-70 factor (ECF subfamily)